MSTIINIKNPEYSFWDLYPELSIIEEFKYIKDTYKKQSSDVMWFIVLCYDLESRFFTLPIEERSELLSKDLMKDIKFFKTNATKLDKAILRFQAFDSAAERHLRQWETTLDKRTKFLNECEYDLDTFEKLDKMAVGSAAIYTTFKKIKEDLQKEKGVITKGGAVPSLADSGDI